jgi:hypothetical protein
MNIYNTRKISQLHKSYNRTNFIIVLFVETPHKFITAKLSIRKPGSYEDPGKPGSIDTMLF